MLHNHNHNEGQGGQPRKPWYQTVGGWATTGLLAVMAYYLWAEHRAHVIAVLPFGILLLCPLMHLFGHGHGGHNHGGSEPGQAYARDDKPAGGSKGGQP